MAEFFGRLLATDFMPHVYCLRDSAIVALHAVSDGLIALAYFLIPGILVFVVRRRRDLAFRWIYILFGVFILACGATHVMSIVTLWRPVYRLEGIIKAVTALASVGTAVLLMRLVPEALAIPGPAALRHEIDERQRAEDRVKSLNAELEHRVSERTRELEAANVHLAELAAIVDHTQTIVQDLNGTIVYWNRATESFYGWTREEALGRKSYELLKSEFPRPFAEIEAELLESGNWKGEFSQRRRDGSIVWVASFWALHRNLRGEPVSVVKVNNDITELKRTSDALRLTEATARLLFENASQGILTAGRDGRIVDANAMMGTLFGYSRDELIGAPLEMLLPEDLRDVHVTHRDAYARQPHARPMGLGMDLLGRRKDGSLFPVEISLSYAVEHRNGLAMAFISDITARRKASQEREDLISRLEGALSEKTVLLKEVHHRVKNNLAVIAGLLGMKADSIDDERARAALEESQQRVESMALIHEFLYTNEHLDRVNFGPYVQQLTRELSDTYAVEANRVAVAVETDDVELSVHRAIPCGLILNELLSNACKYAFPEGQRGEIDVRFGRLESGELSLVCRDNGVGIPENVDWHNAPSLGLRIVRILAKQIDGTLTLDRSGGGTRWELRFLQARAADSKGEDRM
jgi:PAS domain S-box-containing protein